MTAENVLGGSARRRLQRRGRPARLAALAAGVAQLCAFPAFAQNDVFSFEVPPGSAAEVVSAIAQASGDSILFAYQQLAEIDSAGVTGVHTVEDALALALSGSDLVARSTPMGVITIAPREPAAAERPAPPTPPAERPPNPPRPPMHIASAEPLRDDSVKITGTRLLRPGLTTPVPVTAISSRELNQLSPTALIDAIEQLPQFANNSTPGSVLGWSGSAGQSFLNLRGIGSNRTLVLIDGRRLVSSTRRGTVDIGLLPEALLDRVEIVTGGASAAYGSDAMAGVVNFILNKEFEGIGGHVQSGISTYGDAEHVEAGLSMGLSLGPQTRLLLSGDAYFNDGVPNLLARDWHQSWGVIRNPEETGPGLLVRPNVVAANYSHGGLIPTGPLAGTQFLGDGQTAPFDYGELGGARTQIGGDGIDVAKTRTVIPSTERQTAFAYLTHAISPDLTFFVQGLYGRTQAEFDKDPSHMAGLWEAEIFADNAYLPEDIRTRMAEAGVESFPFSRYASKNDLSVGRVNTENRTLSLTFGLHGDLGGWTADAYYQYGGNDQDLNFHDAIRVDRVYRAMDAVLDPATGQPVCRSTLSFPNDGCVPTSFFGDGAVSAAARAWLLDDNTQFQELDQQFFELSFNGEPFRTAAGAAAAVFGGSWRKDTYRQYTAPYTTRMRTPPAEEAGYRGLPEFYSNGYPLLERSVTYPSGGDSEVWELFAETAIPLVADKPLFPSLDAHGALRYAEYDGAGDVWAWKAGLDWTMPLGLRFRGTVSRDVRAGTLAERFDQASQGTTGSDPFLPDRPTYEFGTLLSGNPQILTEKADTLTAGLVYQPDWLPGFGMSADYYDIQIHDAISRLGAQTIINDCFDGAQELCSLISRSSDGYISVVDARFLNLDKVRTRGIDIEASYQTPVALFGGMESIELRALAALYQEASYKSYGLPRNDYAGDVGPGYGLPDHRLLLSASYYNGGLSLNLSGRHTAAGLYNHNLVEGVDIEDNSIDGFFALNARAAYTFETAGGAMEAYLHVENLLNADPPIIPYGAGGFYGAQQTTPDYDRVGRRIAAGLSWRF